MVTIFQNILIIQTAFIGDAILTLPLIQNLKRNYPNSAIDIVAVPRSADVLKNHPAISEIIMYDKRGQDKGILGFCRLKERLKTKRYNLVIVPHRSLRSALLAWFQKPSVGISFNRSAGKWLFTNIVRYDSTAHEINRNLSLLKPLGLSYTENELPRVFPSVEDKRVVDEILKGINSEQRRVTVAPGTIWNTKRWHTEKFIELCKLLTANNFLTMLIGSNEDRELCIEIENNVKSKNIINLAGKLSLLQSAEIISRSNLLVSNDSAPMHLAVAVGTPVIAIYGATVPEFGFAPLGENDVVIETKGLKCRPCAIHGGKKCPIKTFECMTAIKPEFVYENVVLILKKLDYN